MSWKESLKNVEIISFVLALALCGCQVEKTTEKTDDAIAIWLDDVPVSVETFNTELNVKIKTWMIDDELTEEEFAQLIDLTIKEMIEKRILEQEAQERGLNVEEQELIDQAVPAEFPEGFEVLKQSEQEWQSRVSSQLRLIEISRLIALELYKDTEISEDVVKKFYENHLDRFTEPESLELRVIRVNDPDLAKDIHKKLKRGWTFTTLAENYSNYRGEGARGQLFVKRTGEFPPEFDQALVGLKPGRFTSVLTSSEGYFIYKLIKKHPANCLPFEDVQDNLQEELKSREKSRVFTEWLEKKVREVDIRRGTPIPFPGDKK